MEKHKPPYQADQYPWLDLTVSDAYDVRRAIDMARIKTPMRRAVNILYGDNCDYSCMVGQVVLTTHWNDAMQLWSSVMQIGKHQIDFFGEFATAQESIDNVNDTFLKHIS